ncbi:MAG: hypothetical protein ACUZ8O_07820 [Candidatus Anammoxibacter sp.]
MPITEELKNVKKFESVGFSHDQAETLTDVIEQAQISSNESLKEFIRKENKDIRDELRYEINGISNKVDNLNNKVDDLSNKIDSKVDELSNKIDSKVDDLSNKIDGKVDDLSNKIDSKVDDRCNKIDSKIDILRYELKADIATTSKDLLIKLFGIIVGTVGIAVTILKLFP